MTRLTHLFCLSVVIHHNTHMSLQPSFLTSCRCLLTSRGDKRGFSSDIRTIFLPIVTPIVFIIVIIANKIIARLTTLYST